MLPVKLTLWSFGISESIPLGTYLSQSIPSSETQCGLYPILALPYCHRRAWHESTLTLRVLWFPGGTARVLTGRCWYQHRCWEYRTESSGIWPRKLYPSWVQGHPWVSLELTPESMYSKCPSLQRAKRNPLATGNLWGLSQDFIPNDVSSS